MSYESYIKSMENENIDSMPMNCPKCGGFQSLETFTFGIYSSCRLCGYDEWGRGW